MSTAVMTMQQHRPMPAKKMVMMLSPPHDMHQPQIVQPSNGACVIVSNGYPSSPPQFTNLDAPANNNNAKAKNNNCSALNKVSRVGGGVVQKTLPRTSVVVAATPANAAAVDALRCKRRIQFSQPGAAPNAAPGAFTGIQTASVARRNARERNRVKQVNNGFATLRSHIPPAIAAALQEAMGTTERPPSARATAKEKEAAKKLSKVETLRMAVEYIRSLQSLLQESGGSNENAAPATVKTETSDVMSDSPHGFDSDYEAALALSHYSMAAESSSPPTSGVATHVVTSTTSVYPHHNQHHHHPHFVSMSPPCSDAGSAGSPSPSYVSDGSVGPASTGYAAPTTFVPSVCRPTTLTVHSPATPPDSNVYEPMSPEDEELLDVISWWQQSN